jgi:PKHD-type hydroxylase
MTFNFNKKEEKKNIGLVYDCVGLPDLFNDEQIKEIKKIGDSLNFETSKVGSGSNPVLDNYTRRCSVAWFTPNETPKELSDYLEKSIIEINEKCYGFNLTGSEAYQYTVYNEENAGEYKWHIDTSMVLDDVRKLSLSILLSDPSEFEGGKLLLNRDGNIIVAEEKKGQAIFFPSWMCHCVTPVTKGTRKSLVIWVHGPKFK